MRSLRQLAVALAASASLPSAFGLAFPTHELSRRQQVGPAGPDCQNTNLARAAWCPNFNISTDYDLFVPDTGVEVRYDLRISRGPCNYDGATPGKNCTLINGVYPGTPIRAKWGDRIRVIIHNDLPDNGTSIHFHGVRQFNTSQNDGVNGVTECPIAPGTTRTYIFHATQHGTSWYHSHHSAQYGDGVAGPIIIEGPTSANYDVDLGPFSMTDWYYGSPWQILWHAQHDVNAKGIPIGAAAGSDNVLVNGKMVNANGGGSYSKFQVTKGKTYKLRLINMSVDHFFIFSIDGHTFNVTGADFIPTKPSAPKSFIKVNIGQRYDIVFTANQAASNYWMRVDYACATGGKAAIYNSGSVVVGGILSYDTAAAGNPTTSTTLTTGDRICLDEETQSYWDRTVPNATFVQAAKELDITGATQNRTDFNDTIFIWNVNNSTMDVNWGYPTLRYVLDGNNSFPKTLNLYEVNGNGQTWTYWVINNDGPAVLSHPIHLHGHDFWVLGAGQGDFHPSTISGLNFTNPRRRDTATLPAAGHLVIAFPTDNPGAWVMHCHIAWHVSEGLSMQFLERKSEIKSVLGGAIGGFDNFNQGCTEWNRYYNSPAAIWKDEDSGL